MKTKPTIWHPWYGKYRGPDRYKNHPKIDGVIPSIESIQPSIAYDLQEVDHPFPGTSRLPDLDEQERRMK